MRHPILHELNTRVWLKSLSARVGRPVTLADVPDEVFVRWTRLGFTHVWLMGVWTTGPLSRAHSLAEPHLRKRFQEILPDWTEADVSGSPYAVADYAVPAALGGDAGLARFRQRLHAAGLRLLLDFVPNHLGLDHPWVAARPELFVQAGRPVPGAFAQETAQGTKWLAHGRDPFFEPWIDTAQLDYRSPATRQAMIGLLQSVASRCDGVRCDMAMLLLNHVFARAWTQFPVDGGPPPEEFWPAAIAAVRRCQPGFLFLAEVYWDLEQELLALGFDFAYDKTVTDCLLSRRYDDLQRHLLGTPRAQSARMVHFLENHDEPRVASILSHAEHRAASFLMLGLPGMRLLHEGQFEGARVQVPVHLGRSPVEPPDAVIRQWYEKVLALIAGTAVGNGVGQVLPVLGAGPEDSGATSVIAVQWSDSSSRFDLVVVNPGPSRVRCRVAPDLPGLAGTNWAGRDLPGDEPCRFSGAELARKGLPLDLPANAARLLRFEAES